MILLTILLGLALVWSGRFFTPRSNPMATLIRRQDTADSERSGVRIKAFRMYPDSAGIIRLHRGRGRSIVNIHLSPAEADALAKALTRSCS